MTEIDKIKKAVIDSIEAAYQLGKLSGMEEIQKLIKGDK